MREVGRSEVSPTQSRFAKGTDQLKVVSLRHVSVSVRHETRLTAPLSETCSEAHRHFGFVCPFELGACYLRPS